MLQVIEPENRMIIHVECYKENYIAWIEGIGLVSSDSLENVLKELTVSVKVLELYRKSLNK